jgi:hypothetical protein
MATPAVTPKNTGSTMSAHFFPTAEDVASVIGFLPSQRRHLYTPEEMDKVSAQNLATQQVRYTDNRAHDDFSLELDQKTRQTLARNSGPASSVVSSGAADNLRPFKLGAIIRG